MSAYLRGQPLRGHPLRGHPFSSKMGVPEKMGVREEMGVPEATEPENGVLRKIKTRDELKAIIGPRPRVRSVIMCHGVFDLVHPGHVRHLMYAKTKADILIASLTSDAHVSKTDFRPFVPQGLRAMNLAALEPVDFVIIDEYPKPIENIRYLEPDYFAKGYEYMEGGVHPKTQEEIEALKSYGGELIFTPGDVVFSSSVFIEKAMPNLSIEKLETLMDSEGVTFHSLREALDGFQGVRVHVLGDTIVDSYTYCTTISTGSVKTPTLSVKYDRHRDFAGGAAIVAKHLAHAGARACFSSILGNDPLKAFVMAEMKNSNVDAAFIVDPTRMTTQKNVFLSDGYRLLKFDKVDNRPISEAILEKLKTTLASSDADAFVFSDFRHGIFNPGTIPILTESLPKGVFRVADSQMASRWGNILDFQRFDLITPNEKEARFALGDQDSVVRPLALELYKKARCKTLILKLGSRGIMTYIRPSVDVRSFFTIDSFTGPVVDTLGAGDALLAYATLSLVTTGSPVIASILGSMAAGVASEREGNVPVGCQDILEKLDSVEKKMKGAVGGDQR